MKMKELYVAVVDATTFVVSETPPQIVDEMFMWKTTEPNGWTTELFAIEKETNGTTKQCSMPAGKRILREHIDKIFYYTEFFNMYLAVPTKKLHPVGPLLKWPIKR